MQLSTATIDSAEILFSRFPESKSFNFLLQRATRYERDIFVNPDDQSVYVGRLARNKMDIKLDTDMVLSELKREVVQALEKGESISGLSARNKIEQTVIKMAAQLCGGQVSFGKDYDQENVKVDQQPEQPLLMRVRPIDMCAEYASHSLHEKVDSFIPQQPPAPH